METVVSVEGCEEAKVEGGVSGEAGSTLISPADISDANVDPDPVVYKLVRVDGDGRLVPATDDEVLVVEDLLKDEKAEHFISGTRQPMTSVKNERPSLERAQPSLEENQNIQLDHATNLGKENAQQEGTVHLASPSHSKDINSHWSIGYSSPDGVFQNASSNPDFAIRSKPDFSKLRGEICLDKLSVKELHETFRATFGRETSVKDKQWLKRRISMALTNSCDFSTSTFIIKDNVVLKKGKEESSKKVTVSTDFVVGVLSKTVGGPSDGLDDQAKVHCNVDEQKAGSSMLDQDYVTGDPCLKSRAAKRIRKPTKRYIEELSEAESGDSRVRSNPQTVKNSEPGLPRLQARTDQNGWADRKPMVTRHDSLGGSGVMVPYVWRIRRSRPRENFMPLMKLQPVGIDTEPRMVKDFNAPEHTLEKEMDEILQVRLSPARTQQPMISDSEESGHFLERKAMELEKGTELKRVDSFDDISDDNMISNAPGGMRRKHHRPWSLTEVVKLVEGVAKYGAGRWSEIKRLAFASFSYRTSVDLKDKWRNLLRASSSQLPGEKGEKNNRKHGSIPIPAPILMRVRELAQMQAQAPPKLLPQSKLTGHNTTGVGGGDISVFETRPGFL